MNNTLLLKFRKLAEYGVLLMIVVMTVIISYQVISRFGFNYTPAWIQPLSLILMVWIGFLGIAFGIQDNSHIKIDLFVSRMPKKLQVATNLIQRILAILFGFFMLFEGSKFTASMMNSQIPGLGAPSALLYGVVPIAGLLVIVYLIFEFFGKWQGMPEETEVDE